MLTVGLVAVTVLLSTVIDDDDPMLGRDTRELIAECGAGAVQQQGWNGSASARNLFSLFRDGGSAGLDGAATHTERFQIAMIEAGIPESDRLEMYRLYLGCVREVRALLSEDS